MLMISRRADETDQDFANRAFRWNRLCGKAFEDRQARHALCNCNQGRLACGCAVPVKRSASPMPMGAKCDRKFKGATRPLLGVSRVRAIWYVAGLVFGVSLIAMAVFGMGK